MPLQTFKVTKELLKQAADDVKAEGRLSQCCAITAALRVKYPEATSAWSISFNGSYEDRTAIYAVPEVIHYMNLFDGSTYEERLNLPEFEFTLDVPEAVYIP